VLTEKRGGKRYWEEHEVRGIELKAMRLMRKKSLKDMVRGLDEFGRENIEHFNEQAFSYYERSKKPCPYQVVEYYMTTLGISRSHMAQFKKILKGELKTFTEDRTIPTYIKEQVRKKYNNKCADCKSKHKLYFHHDEHFAKGGQNTVENLVVLCADCHAERHKGETPYGMLKSIADKERGQ